MAVHGDLRTALLCLASFFKGAAAQMTLSRDNSFRDYETMSNIRFTSRNKYGSFGGGGFEEAGFISEMGSGCVLRSDA